jgi:hypothetical protein
MNIGIITYHRGNGNYGSSLQASCLASTLESLGHTVRIIDYVPLRLYVWMLLHTRGLSQLCRLLYFSWRQQQFLHHYLTPLSTLPSFDVLVSGSDEVWKINAMRGFDPMYFLGDAAASVRKISYAASAASDQCDPRYKAEISKYLSSMHAISVREESTASFVLEAIGHKPPIVLDPTLLAESPVTVSSEKTSSPYLYLYTEGSLAPAYLPFIMRHTQNHNMSIVSFSPQRHLPRTACHNPFVTLPQWEKQFCNASAVITNTYHGVCMSIRYRRPFVFVGLKHKLYKVQSLLKKLGLEDRELHQPDKLEQYLNTAIDWQAVTSKLEQERVYSLNFLKRSLE